MLIVTGDQIHQILDWHLLMRAFREAHLEAMPEHQRHIMHEPSPAVASNALITLPAWQTGEGLGIKIVTSFPSNRSRHGVPTVNAVYIWLDPETGAPQALLDGEALIFRKTAADSALGSSLLSRTDARCMLMVGAGALAPYLIRAHLAARPDIRRVMVWNRTPSAAVALAQNLREEGYDAAAVQDLESAIPKADLISAATMAHSPLISGAKLAPGTHIDLVGSFTPEMREADDEVLRRSDIYVDSYGTTERSGDFLDPMARGILSREDIKGDMTDLCTGRAGRRARESITMMKNGGGAHFDYFAAREVMRALAAGVRNAEVMSINLKASVR